MLRRRLVVWLLALGLSAVVATLPAPASGSGFQLIEQNASGIGNAFAGQAAGIRNASAVFFNPAALTRVKGWNVVASVDPIDVSTTFANSSSTVPYVTFPAGKFSFPVALGDAGGNAGKWTPVPNGYVSGEVRDRLFVGIGVDVPFGLETNWDASWIGRFHGTKSKVHVINVNPTVAYKLHDMVSVGAGVDWQHLTADFNQQVPFGGLAFAGAAQALAQQPAPVQQALLAAITAQLGGPAGLAAEDAGLINGDSNAWGWNAGVLFKLGEQVHVGASYRSKVSHTIEGTVTFMNPPRLLEAGPTAQIGAALNASFANGPVTTTIELPDTFSVAASWEQEKIELLADWTWTGWDKIQSLDIVRTNGAAVSSVPLNFRNTWRAGVGANYQMNDRLKLRVGTAYDKSPVQNEFRTPRLPDNNRVWIAGGVQWKPAERLAVDAGYAHLFIDDASSSLLGVNGVNTKGDLVGHYKEQVNILGVQVGLTF